ncbi:hypothetical protein BH10BAC3_BH10BAC3_34290 [soil metagenome]
MSAAVPFNDTLFCEASLYTYTPVDCKTPLILTSHFFVQSVVRKTT